MYRTETVAEITVDDAEAIVAVGADQVIVTREYASYADAEAALLTFTITLDDQSQTISATRAGACRAICTPCRPADEMTREILRFGSPFGLVEGEHFGGHFSCIHADGSRTDGIP